MTPATAIIKGSKPKIGKTKKNVNFKEFTLNFLNAISSKPKKSLQVIKNLVNSEGNLKKSLIKERQEFYKLLDSENKKIGIKSFLNKTKPNWK